MALPSRHQIGEIVLFQPNTDKIDWKEMTCKPEESVECEIVGIRFTTGKILYDLAIKEGNRFYTELPLRDIDSCLICPTVDFEG